MEAGEEERRHLFHQDQILYSRRSKLAHGQTGKLKEADFADVEEGAEILCRTLLKVAEMGHTKLDVMGIDLK